MKLLLDTHLLLWSAGSPDRLPATARILLEDPENELFFSAASLWEIGYLELAISSEHAVSIDCLPLIHKDPFDRILVAQAIVEGIVLLTADALVAHSKLHSKRYY